MTMPPPARCARMTSREQTLRGGVERGRRLVEQPQRARGDEQPRERDAPLLPRRERAHREIGDMRQAQPRQRRSDAATHRRPASAPRNQGFPPRSAPPSARRRGRDNASALAGSPSSAPPSSRTRPAANPRKPASAAQQARLAGAVRTRHDKRLARAHPERKPGEQPPPAALQRQVFGDKAHGSP